MANRRMISKSISTSTKVNVISDFAALLFTWMVCHADDYGVMEGDVGTVRALVVPRRKQTEVQVGHALSEIQKIGLIWWYVYKNRKYIQVINWEEHQEGLHKRTASKHPLYQDCCLDSENFREIPGNSPLTKPKGTELKRSEPNPPPAYDYFTDFYKEYPRKKKRLEAEKAFEKLNMNDDLMNDLMAALYKEINSFDWKKDGGKFIPYPATWLNGRRWEDEIT